VACPVYTFEIIDTDTNAAATSSIFVSDLVSATKTLDVATTDYTLAKTYNLAL